MPHAPTRHPSIVLGSLVLLALLIGPAMPAGAQCAELPGCVLVWSDEFDGATLNGLPCYRRPSAPVQA